MPSSLVYAKDDAHGRALLRVCLEDALHAPSAGIRREAASRLAAFCAPVAKDDDRTTEPPIGALLAACELASDPTAGDARTRVHDYAYPVCEALDVLSIPRPPIELSRAMPVDSQSAESQLAVFGAALPDLEARLRAQHDPADDDALRAELDGLAPR